MEKVIEIDGKQIRFKTTGATVLRYKAQFGKDFFKELMKLNALGNTNKVKEKDLEALDFEVFYNLAWVMAKTADPSIPDPISWLDTFDEFPMVDIIPELNELIISTLHSTKKKKVKG
jgi:hypothetical protein